MVVMLMMLATALVVQEPPLDSSPDRLPDVQRVRSDGATAHADRRTR
jgi:hypothetical protein